jgi:hypothetical protein
MGQMMQKLLCAIGRHSYQKTGPYSGETADGEPYFLYTCSNCQDTKIEDDTSHLKNAFNESKEFYD